MLKRFIFSAVVVAVSSLGSFSCGSTGTPVVDAGSDPELICDASPPATTFSKVYSDIFTPACISCHKMGAPDGSDNYGLYNTEVAAFGQVGHKSLYAGSDTTLKVVDPNNLATSTMYLKVMGKKGPGDKTVGALMPLGGPALSAVQKKLLKDWICSGAKM